MNFSQIKKEVTPSLPLMQWSPHWEIVLVYERPDIQENRHILIPSFFKRHANPEANDTSRILITRDDKGSDEDPAGAHVSAAALSPVDPAEREYIFPDELWEPEEIRGGALYANDDGLTAHQRDWDFLCNILQDEFNKVGITEDSPDIEKASALSELNNRKRGKIYPSRHPVDVALNSSFCVGSANLFAALCHIAGLPARTINNLGHSMAEVFIDGRWHFTDNITDGSKKTYGGENDHSSVQAFFPDYNYVQIVSDSNIPGMFPKQSAHYRSHMPHIEPFINIGSQRWKFNHCGNGFDRNGGPLRTGNIMMMHPCPDNIESLYPGWEDAYLPSIPGRDNELILNTRQSWCKSPFFIDRQTGIRKRFYIGSLDYSSNALKKCRCDLHLVESCQTGFDPLRGGWEFNVNGSSVPLDRDNYELKGDILSIDIPMDHLKEDSFNTVTLFSEKKYKTAFKKVNSDTIFFWMHPDILAAEKPWYYCSESLTETVQKRLDTYITVDNHSAYYLLNSVI